MFFLGLDLGKQRDFSAVAVVERHEKLAGCPARVVRSFGVRHLERMPLGTAYTAVVQRVCTMMRHQSLRGQCRLVIDATGVGAPVVELFAAAGLGAWTTAVTITGGEKANGSDERWSVPRKDLLAGVEVLLEAGDLVISRQLRDAELLVRELEQIDAGGEHDDLALALALACWRARRKSNSFGTAPLPGI